MKKKVVRYGLISTSQIGMKAHLPASLESKNAESTAYAKSFGPELEGFSQVVLDGATPAAGPEESLAELRTVLALYRSVQSERWEPVWD